MRLNFADFVQKRQFLCEILMFLHNRLIRGHPRHDEHLKKLAIVMYPSGFTLPFS